MHRLVVIIMTVEAKVHAWLQLHYILPRLLTLVTFNMPLYNNRNNATVTLPVYSLKIHH